MARYVDQHDGNPQDEYNKVQSTYLNPVFYEEATYVMTETTPGIFEFDKKPSPDPRNVPDQIPEKDMWIYLSSRDDKIFIRRLNGTYERWNIRLLDQPDINSQTWGPHPWPQQPKITNEHLADGKVGDPYGPVALMATGVTPFTWTVTGLPAGITFDDTSASISGTPTVDGIEDVTILVENAKGKDQKVLQLIVEA